MIAQSKLIELRNMLAKEIPIYRSEYSLLVEVCDELMEYRAADAPLPTHKPTPVEALAERLAKVEDSLANTENNTHRVFNLTRVVGEHHLEVNQRIDKVAEIIGDRVTGLVNDNNMILDSVKRAHERLDVHEIAFHYVYKALDQVMLRSGFGNMSSEYPLTPAFPNAPAFPTGGAHTLEGATEAVLPVPQRGDRVRLEGLDRGDVVSDGWYDVVGVTEWGVQIENGFDGYGTKRLYNVERSHVKEVKHNDKR